MTNVNRIKRAEAYARTRLRDPDYDGQVRSLIAQVHLSDDGHRRYHAIIRQARDERSISADEFRTLATALGDKAANKKQYDGWSTPSLALQIASTIAIHELSTMQSMIVFENFDAWAHIDIFVEAVGTVKGRNNATG